MVPPQHRIPGQQQSLTATDISPPQASPATGASPTPLEIPDWDTTTALIQGVTTTPHPSVTATPRPSGTADHHVVAGSLPNSGNDATRRQRLNFAESIEYPQGNTRLPSNFCLQCLACHPVKSGRGTYHIRTFQKNLEMHSAISTGLLPKVDPWESIVKEFKPPSPKPTPEPAQTQQSLSSRTLSEAGKRYLESATEGLSGNQQMRVLITILGLEAQNEADRRRQSAIAAQQASEAQGFAPYATAATTGSYGSHYPPATQLRWQSPEPTGPPPKKRRRAGNTYESSGRTSKGVRSGGAQTANLQVAGNQRANAAQTSQPTTTPASNTEQRQRASSYPLDKIRLPGQPKTLKTANAPATGAPTKTPAEGEATVVSFATDREAAQEAADEATAEKAAPTDEQST